MILKISSFFVFLAAFIDMPELIAYMRQNYIRWKEFDEQGHTTLADIHKLQSTAHLAPMFPTKTSTGKKKSDKKEKESE